MSGPKVTKPGKGIGMIGIPVFVITVLIVYANLVHL